MLAIDARETAPASATPNMFPNHTGTYSGMTQSYHHHSHPCHSHRHCLLAHAYKAALAIVGKGKVWTLVITPLT